MSRASSEHSVSSDGAAAVRRRVVYVSKLNAGEALAKANEAGYKTRRPRRPDSDPARRVANYFLDQWEKVVVERRPEFHSLRPGESYDRMKGYIRSVFFKPSAGRKYSEEEVCAIIDRWLVSFYRGEVKVKTNQTVWQCFTGTWGRDQRPVQFDYEASRRKRLGLDTPSS